MGAAGISCREVEATETGLTQHYNGGINTSFSRPLPLPKCTRFVYFCYSFPVEVILIVINLRYILYIGYITQVQDLIVINLRYMLFD
jgi:hypothetical protein